MSYTEAFQPQAARTVILDFSKLASIREVNAVDGDVTVEAGCTWAALDAPIDALRGAYLDERRRSVRFPRGSWDEAARARLWALSEEQTGSAVDC